MTLIADYGLVLLVLACLFGFFMAWGVGANDVANAMGTSVGSRALTIKQAIIIAMVFEFAGAYLAGGQVTETIKSGIVDASVIPPQLMVLGMMSALLAAGTWLLIASTRGWPVSTTHSIVGAVIGFAAVGISMDAVHWEGVGPIVASWVVSPVLSGLVAFGIFVSVQKLIIDTDNPFLNAKRFVPLYMFATGFMVSIMTVTKGLKHIGLNLSPFEGFLLAVGIGVAVMLLGVALLSRIRVDAEADKDFHYASVEKVFAVLMIFTACSMAFAHGSNEVANGLGPMAAVIQTIASGEVSASSPITPFILFVGSLGMVAGLTTYGYKVMATLGHRITELTPTRAYCATVAAASVTVAASGLGLPVSTTHIAVGAVMGVGIARGIGALDLRVVGGIIVSWFITVPVGALLGALIFHLLKAAFS